MSVEGARETLQEEGSLLPVWRFAGPQASLGTLAAHAWLQAGTRGAGGSSRTGTRGARQPAAPRGQCLPRQGPLLVPRWFITWGVPQVKSEIGPVHGRQGKTEEADRSRLVGGSVSKQGTYHEACLGAASGIELRVCPPEPWSL